MSTEELWRASLHDFNNLLAGLQGVLDLSDPRLPLDARNRMRLESSVEEGKTLIAMARSLALGRHLESGPASWREFEHAMRSRLGIMSELYRCPIDLVEEGASTARWPTPVLVEWAAAFTRQILPWAAPGPLRLSASLAPDAWELTWHCDAPIPSALLPDPAPDAPKNLAGLWLRATGDRLDIAVQTVPDGLQARMKRP
jgi:hypothetical protein